jgi:hypothetical protein
MLCVRVKSAGACWEPFEPTGGAMPPDGLAVIIVEKPRTNDLPAELGSLNKYGEGTAQVPIPSKENKEGITTS